MRAYVPLRGDSVARAPERKVICVGTITPAGGFDAHQSHLPRLATRSNLDFQMNFILRMPESHAL